MRIGVIGAGVSGVTAAWLLQNDHDVTLMDKAPKLGGHVESIAVEVSGVTVHAEIGPRFFFDAAYPYFMGLLRLLDVPLRWNDGRVSFTCARNGSSDLGRRQTIVLPPRSVRQVASLLRSPPLLRHALSLHRLVEEQEVVAARRDYTTSFRAHLARAGYPDSFGPEFAYPFLAACWGAPLELLPEFPAYSLLKGMPSGKAPGFYEVVGGMSRYMAAFGRELTRVEKRLGVGIRSVTRGADYLVEDDRGEVHRFDRLIVATSSRDAASLLHGVPGVAEMKRAVGTFRHFDTEIVIHGDPSLMPPDQRDWSHCNLFFEGTRAWMSDWQGLRDGVPVFRTWLPKGHPAPQSLYARRSFHHLVMTPENALLQRRIASAQGAAGLWVTGMYAADVDNHESALLSAVVPARALAPRSANLARLSRAVAPNAAHGFDVLPEPFPKPVERVQTL